jgi:hypothetical protein
MQPWSEMTELGHYGKSKKRTSLCHQKLPRRLKDGKQTLQPSCGVTVPKFLYPLMSITTTLYLCVLLPYPTRFYGDLSRLYITTLSPCGVSQKGIPAAKRQLNSHLMPFASHPSMIEKQSERTLPAGLIRVESVELSLIGWEAFGASSSIQTSANGCKCMFQ